MMNRYQRIALGLAVALGLGLGVGPAQAQTADEGRMLVLPFTDVPEDHWAFQALLNLAGVYGCMSGYPDGTFRGEDSVTRYEFVAGMDACLGVLNTMLQQQQSQQQELNLLREDLQQSFEELRDLEGSL